MRFEDHFSEHADQYAAYRPSYPQSLVDFLASLAPTCEVAWDAGSGSGQFSVVLTTRFDQVIATDASSEQIARAAPHPRIEYRVALAESSGIASGTVDLAVAAQAVHWFDLHGYYDEVRRTGRPDGVIALVAYGLMTIDRDIDRKIGDLHSRVLEPFWPPERRHIDNGYRSFDFPFAELAAPELEIHARWTVHQLVGYLQTWSAVRALHRSGGGEALDLFFSELRRSWGSGEQRAIRWPLILRVGRI